jgi:hypothetical protein
MSIKVAKEIVEIIYYSLACVLNPAWIIAWTVLELAWETIKFMFVVGYELVKAVTVIASLVLLSFFRVFVLGIVTRG